MTLARGIRGLRRGRGARRIGMAVLAAIPALVAAPSSAQQTHLLVVAGIGGGAAYTERFLEWGTALRSAAIERYGVPAEQAVLLSEDPDMSEAATGESRRDDVEAHLAALAGRVQPADRVLVVLIGHGSFRDGQASFNLPGPDLSAAEWKALLDALPTERVALVNTASASGPFASELTAPGRVVITATASGNERNETRFGQYFAAAWVDGEADLDKNGSTSLLEAFQYARREVERFYSDENRLLTEHAMLEDDGDGEGTREPTLDTPDGAVAATFTLGLPGARAAVTAEGAPSPIPATSDTVLVRLYGERADLEARVAELRRMQGSLDPNTYEQELEALLVELALKNREIRAREGGE